MKRVLFILLVMAGLFSVGVVFPTQHATPAHAAAIPKAETFTPPPGWEAPIPPKPGTCTSLCANAAYPAQVVNYRTWNVDPANGFDYAKDDMEWWRTPSPSIGYFSYYGGALKNGFPFYIGLQNHLQVNGADYGPGFIFSVFEAPGQVQIGQAGEMQVNSNEQAVQGQMNFVSLRWPHAVIPGHQYEVTLNAQPTQHYLQAWITDRTGGGDWYMGKIYTQPWWGGIDNGTNPNFPTGSVWEQYQYFGSCSVPAASATFTKPDMISGGVWFNPSLDSNWAICDPSAAIATSGMLPTIGDSVGDREWFNIIGQRQCC